MEIRFLDKEIVYDGTQLRSHFNFEQTGLIGDSAVAFIGPCHVDVEHLVDLEDALHGRIIQSQSMLHFIGEFYGATLKETILFQRLIVSLLQQRLMQENGKVVLRRSGNDLYDGQFKLSVSIATCSPVSTLLHLGVNILSEGTPVPTKGLNDYNIAAPAFAAQLLQDIQTEWASLRRDCAKARAVS